MSKMSATNATEAETFYRSDQQLLGRVFFVTEQLQEPRSDSTGIEVKVDLNTRP